jgi:uncharacterized damage-inducible protein DinB
MIQQDLIYFFERDLLKWKEEISLYEQEADLWAVRGDIANSTGNLTLHLVGNLNHFIGATLGHTGYVRQRDDEFALKNISRSTLLIMLDDTRTMVVQTLQNLSADDIEKDFPLEKHGKTVRTTHMLLHLMAHLSYHLGQINYHRRMI